ncbi:unnamed protein product [Adineta steineri]|uniref:G-protein coupled receptors family 1 profile domain-containing protein n=2 Tax=Adineta steineri TaxID=433720 RepID=A0A814CE54_9BILA|nr:unnamed protein product [Adineta steineri]
MNSLDFLVSAFTNLIGINVGIITLVYTYDWPSATTTTYCKTRSYTYNASQQMSRFLIVAACFDRFALCSNSVRLRKICQVRIACRYIIPSIILVWLLIPLHVPILFISVGNTCVFPGAGALYNSIYSIVMVSLVPPGLMLIFSLLIFRNLKMRQRRRQQIHPLPVITSAAIGIRRQQAKDQQVLAMLLIQVFAYVSSTIFYTVNLLYSTLTMNDAANKSIERKIIEGFATFCAGILLVGCPCLSFYSFTLASRLFRKELKLMILHACGRWLHCPQMINNNRIIPTDNSNLTHKVTTRFEHMQRSIAVPPPLHISTIH